MDIDNIDFGGEVIVIAEKEFSASPSSELTDRLYSEWKSAGSPSDYKNWIRARLRITFISVNEPPRWPRDVQEWPEHAGNPMTFLGQLHLPDFALPSGHRCSAASLFVFGAPDGPPTGWSLVTKTICLPDSLRGAKLRRVIKGPDKL